MSDNTVFNPQLPDLGLSFGLYTKAPSDKEKALANATLFEEEYGSNADSNRVDGFTSSSSSTATSTSSDSSASASGLKLADSYAQTLLDNRNAAIAKKDALKSDFDSSQDDYNNKLNDWVTAARVTFFKQSKLDDASSKLTTAESELASAKAWLAIVNSLPKLTLDEDSSGIFNFAAKAQAKVKDCEEAVAQATTAKNEAQDAYDNAKEDEEAKCSLKDEAYNNTSDLKTQAEEAIAECVAAQKEMDNYMNNGHEDAFTNYAESEATSSDNLTQQGAETPEPIVPYDSSDDTEALDDSMDDINALKEKTEEAVEKEVLSEVEEQTDETLDNIETVSDTDIALENALGMSKDTVVDMVASGQMSLIEVAKALSKVVKQEQTAQTYAKGGSIAKTENVSVEEHAETESELVDTILGVSNIVESGDVEFVNMTDESNYKAGMRIVDRINSGEYIKTDTLNEHLGNADNIELVESSTVNDTQYEEYSNAILDQLQKSISNEQGSELNDQTFNAIKSEFEFKAATSPEDAFKFLEDEARKHGIDKAIEST